MLIDKINSAGKEQANVSETWQTRLSDWKNFREWLGRVAGTMGLGFEEWNLDNKGVGYTYEKLGIYLAEFAGLKLAVAFNSSSLEKPKNYCRDLTSSYHEHGWRIIQVWEHEFRDPHRAGILVSMIETALRAGDGQGGTASVLYARNLRVGLCEAAEAKEFLSKYHMQGNSGMIVGYGLYDGTNQLIGLMTFGAPRFDNNSQWELIRLCWKPGARVVGGAEKLFKQFVRDCSPREVISYCDRAKFDGKVYTRLGFQLSDTPVYPNYCWVNEDEALPRYKCQKHKLIKRGWGTVVDTERSIMKRMGYSQIHDCGNDKYIWRA